MKPRRFLLLAAASSLAATLGTLWWSQRSSDSAPTASAASASGLQWRAETAQQYDVRLDSSMRMSAGAASPADLRVRIDGTLDFLTLRADAESADVGLRFSSVELEVAGNTDAATNRALTAPFRVRFSRTGMPESFEFPATVDAQNRATLENLVRTFQLALREGDDWIARESNAIGSYEAAYRRVAPSRVEKAKRRFIGEPLVPTYIGAEVESTEVLITDEQRDWLATMTIDETIRTAGQGGPALEVVNRASLALRSSLQPGTSRGAWEFAAATAPAAIDRATSDLSPEQAQRLIRAETAALDAATEGRTPRVHRLRDLLRADAALPAFLLEIMQSEELTDRTRADLYLALELAGTEPAQAALASVIGNPAWSTRDSMRAIVALGGVDDPSPATVASLWTTAQGLAPGSNGLDLASTATLALGNLGQVMNENSNADYASLRTRLVAGALGGTGTPEQRVSYIHAVGNTRDATLARDIMVLLDDPEPDVRRAAALSLGRLDVDQSADQLLSRFEREQSPEVRGAIVESLVSWTAPTAEAVGTMRNEIGTEGNENTRFQMARFLSGNLAQYQENRPVLEALLRTERSSRIRQSVAEALAAPL